jgi:hypothetical protein
MNRVHARTESAGFRRGRRRTSGASRACFRRGRRRRLASRTAAAPARQSTAATASCGPRTRPKAAVAAAALPVKLAEEATTRFLTAHRAGESLDGRRRRARRCQVAPMSPRATKFAGSPLEDWIAVNNHGPSICIWTPRLIISGD